MHLNTLFGTCGIVLSAITTCAKKQLDLLQPAPQSELTEVSLSEEERGFVQKANTFALNCSRALFANNGGESMFFSPLSLQYALGMVLNGASGDTAVEIAEALGYGSDINELNTFLSDLMVQLPAVDTTVDFRIANAMLVNKAYKVKHSFSDVLNNLYYAPVEYTGINDISKVVEMINEWSYRNTNGFINPLVDLGDLSGGFVSVLLNALYFKAKWAEEGGTPLFRSEATSHSQPFYADGGKVFQVDYLRASHYLPFARTEGYRALELPYANRRFAMYVLLPENRDQSSVPKMLASLTEKEWSNLMQSLKVGPEVHISIPKFETEKKYKLADVLQGLGIKKAFMPGQAEFDRLFDSSNQKYCIDEIIQKSRIKVAEWGTEAASVTAEVLIGAYIPENYVEEYFVADHPFVYLIAEKSSGIILFSGVFDGK